MNAKSKLKIFIQLIPLAIVALAYQNCAKLKFSADELLNPTQSTSTPSVQPAAPIISDITDSYSISGFDTGTPFDIAWVVDNSSTMGKVSTAMQTYMPSFISALESNSDVRLALISQSSGAYNGKNSPYVALPPGLDPTKYTQIDVLVDNKSALDKLSDYTINQLIPNGFFRNNVHKMFIVASDNDANISADEFLNRMSSQIIASKMGFYAFIGVGTSAPCAVNQGLQYLELITKVFDGRSYNICGGDWKSNFDDLAGHFIRPDNFNVFSLSQSKILEFYSVKINNQPLASSQYTLEGRTLTILDKNLLTQGTLVTVEYKAQTN